MGRIIKLFAGRTRRGEKLPKPVDCAECGEPIETARLQALATRGGNIDVALSLHRYAKLCRSCAGAAEAREKRILANSRPDEIVIIGPRRR